VLYSRRQGYQSQFGPLQQAQTKADSPFADLIGWYKPISIFRWMYRYWAARAGLTERSFYRKFLAAGGETRPASSRRRGWMQHEWLFHADFR
jgi:transcriptional regulator GlxA family with amidase domain